MSSLTSAGAFPRTSGCQLSDELRLIGSFALALIAALALVPVAIRLALRTGFMDIPLGYKGHSRPTPYLGGVAVMTALAVSVLAFGGVTSRYAPILIWTVVLFAVGTVDDKRNLNPAVRLVIEAGAGFALWYYGLGWAILPGDVPNIALTILWVVGVVNAFNLMDNMDGASSTVGALSAGGTAAVAIVGGNLALGVVMLAVAGACLGFLRYNLARPARIFLGDGGSMPLGFIIAAGVMALPLSSSLNWTGLFAAVPLVGLPILDTTLVVISRRRAGRPILAGGRDHLTHRLRALVGTPQAVAICLAAVQSVLCLTALALSQLDRTWVVAVAAAYLPAAAFAIYILETAGLGAVVPSGSVEPESSAA
jgi:UDP-GlcNAc:undecaprenyl-phosphate GlcNAc-1-phosphate transferase